MKSVGKSDIIDQLEPLTVKYYNKFSQCEDCGKIFWKGSHYKNLEEFIKNINGSENLWSIRI